MARPPSQKGTSFLPVVMALKQHPDREKLVPQNLWKYFEEPVLVSGWYPERDYWVLIAALVKTMDHEHRHAQHRSGRPILPVGARAR